MVACYVAHIPGFMFIFDIFILIIMEYDLGLFDSLIQTAILQFFWNLNFFFIGFFIKL